MLPTIPTALAHTQQLKRQLLMMPCLVGWMHCGSMSQSLWLAWNGSWTV